MSSLEIVTYPAEILRAGAKPVEEIDDQLQRLIEDMIETMYGNAGIGLASVQVGNDRQVIIYDISEERDKRCYKALLNPRIIAAEGVFDSEQEGCLSVPELRVDVKRSACVSVEAVDREGKPVRIDAEGLEAVVLQHEIDHLNGVLILDKASRLRRQLYNKKIKKMTGKP
jgi:peptide deformylase